MDFRKMLNKFLNWLITSSADPEEYSMTIKSAVLVGVGYLIPFITLLHIPVSATTITNDVALGCQALGILLTIVGLVRKLILTITAAINGKTLPPTTI